MKVSAGHDKNLFMVVTRIESEGYVYLADGKTRKLSKPKKKKVMHVRPTREVVEDIDLIISKTDSADAALRKILKKYNYPDKPEGEYL